MLFINLLMLLGVKGWASWVLKKRIRNFKVFIYLFIFFQEGWDLYKFDFYQWK